jgi:hypothetical protein
MADLNQALPTSFPDLGTLYDRMPGFASMQAGEQSRLAEQNNQALQNAFGAQEAYKAQERPIDLASKQQEIEASKALAGYHGALGFNTSVDAARKYGTLLSDISAGISSNRTKIGANQIEQQEQLGDRFRMAGAAAATETDPYRKINKVKQALGDAVEDSPELDQYLLQHADTLHQEFTDMGNNIFNASRSAKVENQKLEAEQRRTETQAGATIGAATIGATSREQVAATQAVARIQTAIESKANSAKDQAAALVRQALALPEGQQRQALLQQAQISAQVAAHMAEIAAQARNETGITASQLIGTATPPRAPMPPVYPPQGQTPPEIPPQAAPAGVAVSPTDQIRKAFGDYNPDEYDYRIDPQTGAPQRRKKAK